MANLKLSFSNNFQSGADGGGQKVESVILHPNYKFDSSVSSGLETYMSLGKKFVGWGGEIVNKFYWGTGEV